MNNIHFRHEFKYVCSDAQFEILKYRLSGLMTYDKHADFNGKYDVRSIYFDNIDNSYYHENEDGISPREKYRIRIYNNRDALIDLERKQKVNGMTHKDSVHISHELCDSILLGNGFLNLTSDVPMLNCFISNYNTRLLRPKVIVDYERTVYVCPLGNVRITFDRNISGSVDFANYFSKNISSCPIMSTGQHILEVKYDNYLPDYIYKAAEIGNLERTTFSKYYLCRASINNCMGG